MRYAFTLIELLVVVAIIVVLLALLTPALDKAVYLTELTTCGARQHTDIAAVQLYAMDNKRTYPRPQGGRTNSFDYLGPRDGTRSKVELVPLLEKRIPLDAFKCPMLGGISYDPGDNLPVTFLFSNYYMFFGAQYTDVKGNKGMFRLGDALEYRLALGEPPKPYRVLMMDLNGADTTSYAMTGHPDLTGTLPRRTWQNQVSTGGALVTFARWQNGTQKTGDYRGPVDLNFAFDDGSVRRLDGLTRQDEDRTDRLPYYASGSALDIYVPPK